MQTQRHTPKTGALALLQGCADGSVTKTQASVRFPNTATGRQVNKRHAVDISEGSLSESLLSHPILRSSHTLWENGLSVSKLQMLPVSPWFLGNADVTIIIVWAMGVRRQQQFCARKHAEIWALSPLLSVTSGTSRRSSCSLVFRCPPTCPLIQRWLHQQKRDPWQSR